MAADTFGNTTSTPGAGSAPNVSLAPVRAAAVRAPKVAGPSPAQTAAFYHALATRAGNGAPTLPQVNVPQPGLNPVAGTPLSANPMPAAGGTVDQQYNNLLNLLNTNLTNAHTGIGAVGNQVAQQLTSLAQGASSQGSQIARDIAAQYASQRAQGGADQARLLADLKAQGANVGVLQATAGQAANNLAGEQGRQAALQANLQHILGSSMANREAGAAQTTAGTQQMLTTKGALLQSQIEAQRMQALQAQAAAMAAARYGVGRGGGGGGFGRGGGGGRGGSGSGAPTLAEQIAIAEKTQLPAINYMDYLTRAGIDWAGNNNNPNPAAQDVTHQSRVFMDILGSNPNISVNDALNLMGGRNGPAFNRMDSVQRQRFFNFADAVNSQQVQNKGQANSLLQRLGY